MALTDKLTAIADAIRTKTGESGKMTLDQMPTKISGIETGHSVDLSGITAVESDVLSTASFMTSDGSIMQGSIPIKNSDNVSLTLMSYPNGGSYYAELSFPAGYYESDVYQTLDLSGVDDGLHVNMVETTWMSSDCAAAVTSAIDMAIIAKSMFGATIWPIGIGFSVPGSDSGTTISTPIIFGNILFTIDNGTATDFAFRAMAGSNSDGTMVVEIDMTSDGGASLTKLEIAGNDYASSVTNTTPVRIFTLGY